MKQSFRALLLLLALAATASGAGPRVTLPAEVKARPGRVVRLEATTDGKVVRWATASDHLDLIPFPGDGKAAIAVVAPDVFDDQKHLVVKVPVRIKIFAWTALGDVPSESAFCVIVVDPPKPEPGPTPPPVPPIPPPDDTFVQGLQAAYGADGAVDKAASKANLAALYRQSAETAKQSDVATWGALFDAMRRAATSLGIAGKSPAVQGMISTELLRLKVPNPAVDGEKVIDADGRALASTAFKRIADSLEQLR